MNKSRCVAFVFCIMMCITRLYGQDVGRASFYADGFHGKKMANGVPYHRDSMYCAHKTYPLGTLLQVTNPRNKKKVVVRVTDRGPHTQNRIIDLSYAAAKKLDIVRFGHATVEVREYEPIVVPFRPLDMEKKSKFELADDEDDINFVHQPLVNPREK